MTTKNRRSLKDIAQQSNRLETSDNMTSGNSEDLAARLKKSLFGESPEAAQDRDLEAGVSNSKNSRSADSDGGTGFRAMDVQAGSNSDRESSDGGSNSRRFSKSIGGSELDAAGAQSLIERAVHTTLERVCRLSSEDPAPIELIEQVGVLPIDSNNLWGYLVLAWPNDEIRAKEAFFKLTQKILQLVFNEMGVQARLEPGFFVTIPEVEFVSWSQEQAAFSFSTAHGNEEIGVAYFPTSKPFPKPREVEDKSMCSIGLENISTEQPVTFKVYLHMKKNKKYFLYLRNGRSLQPEQKERLKDGNVKDLYMKSIDVENLRMFLAACHLREKIKGSGEEAA